MPRKDVFFVIDDSGSMGSYSRLVREAIRAMTSVNRNTEETTYCYKYISFSSKAAFSEDLHALPIPLATTNIEAAFSLMNEKVAICQLPEELIVVFISDGCDNHSSTINARLKALGGTKSFVPTTLFTVAVGHGFPTAMVVSALRPCYHSASDCLPLVFPVSSPSEVMNVFEQMSSYVFNKPHFGVSLTFSENNSLAELEEGVDAVYNYYTVKAANESDKNKCIAMIQEANAILGVMLALAKEKEQEKKEALGDAMQDAARKPLASRILSVAQSQRKRVQTSILGAITRFNTYLEETVKGNLLSSLSDQEKQKVLSYGNVVGKHLVKSLKYHSADFQATKSHLAKVLTEYDAEQAEADAGVCDYIISQAEAMSDAQECAPDVLNNAESLASIVDTVAVVGRLMNIKTCSGTQINPYLLQVVSVPTILQHMNTIDFFRLHAGEYHDVNRPGEIANCLLPVTRNTSPKSFLRGPLGAHVCSYLLCRNQELIFPRAMHAMQAALVTFCLQQPGAFYQDVLEETYASFEAVTAGHGMGKYCEHVATPAFREALVTESDTLPKHLKCEHLTKFIFAVYVLVRSGTRLSTSELLERMRACMVEMVGRGGEGGAGAIYQFVTHRKQRSVKEVLDMVPREAAVKAFTAHEAHAVFEQSAKKLCRGSDACAITNVTAPDDIPVSCMGITRAALSAIFARLNAMAGNDPTDAFEVPDRMERLAIMQHGLAHSSLERNVTNASVAPVSLEQLQGEIEHAYGARVCKDAEGYIAPLFRRHFEVTHQAVMPLPPDYRRRYKAETGRDVTDDFSVSEDTWLPNVACAAPDCPNFLRRMANPAVTGEGKPRIADALLRHLQTEPLWMIHCGSRCAKSLADEGADEDKTRYMTALLAAGELMHEGGSDTRKRKACQMESVEHLGGEGQLRKLVQEKREEYEHFETKMRYERFKGIMDAAYALTPMESAAQSAAAMEPKEEEEEEAGGDFEMVEVP